MNKDDAAIGEVLHELDRLGLRERTLVVVTADHGETLSAAHDWVVKLDGRKQNMRFRHAPAMWEETARVPILLRLPGRVPAGRRVSEPVAHHRSVAHDPRSFEAADRRADQRAFAGPDAARKAAARSAADRRRPSRRARFSSGAGAWSNAIRRRASLTTPETERSYELYDLESDPGERINLIEQRRDVAADLLKRLAAVRVPAKPLACRAGTAPWPWTTARGRFGFRCVCRRGSATARYGNASRGLGRQDREARRASDARAPALR